MQYAISEINRSANIFRTHTYNQDTQVSAGSGRLDTAETQQFILAARRLRSEEMSAFIFRLVAYFAPARRPQAYAK